MSHWLFNNIKFLTFVGECKNTWDPHPFNLTINSVKSV